jgi:signal recognition particle GTPase
MVADSIPEDRMIEMISKDGDTQYTVESFNQETILYIVKINEDGKIVSCSCCYFKFNSAVCKHMYLLKRHINIEVEVLSRMETLLSQASIPVLAATSINNNISDSVSSQDVERDHDILDNVYKRLKEIRQIIDSADNSRRMGTQRSLNN